MFRHVYTLNDYKPGFGGGPDGQILNQCFLLESVPGSTVHRWSLHERYLLESDGADLLSYNVLFFFFLSMLLPMF
jgi:hypothetical protein